MIVPAMPSNSSLGIPSRILSMDLFSNLSNNLLSHFSEVSSRNCSAIFSDLCFKNIYVELPLRTLLKPSKDAFLNGFIRFYQKFPNDFFQKNFRLKKKIETSLTDPSSDLIGINWIVASTIHLTNSLRSSPRNTLKFPLNLSLRISAKMYSQFLQKVVEE